MTEYLTKRVKSPRVADRLQREGWELVAIDRKLTLPNVFHLKKEKPTPQLPEEQQLPFSPIQLAEMKVKGLDLKIHEAQRKGKVKRAEALQRKLEKAQQKLSVLEERVA